MHISLSDRALFEKVFDEQGRIAPPKLFISPMLTVGTVRRNGIWAARSEISRWRCSA